MTRGQGCPIDNQEERDGRTAEIREERTFRKREEKGGDGGGPQRGRPKMQIDAGIDCLPRAVKLELLGEKTKKRKGGGTTSEAEQYILNKKRDSEHVEHEVKRTRFWSLDQGRLKKEERQKDRSIGSYGEGQYEL